MARQGEVDKVTDDFEMELPYPAPPKRMGPFLSPAARTAGKFSSIKEKS
jgi:hypothetical protein